MLCLFRSSNRWTATYLLQRRLLCVKVCIFGLGSVDINLEVRISKFLATRVKVVVFLDLVMGATGTLPTITTKAIQTWNQLHRIINLNTKCREASRAEPS